MSVHGVGYNSAPVSTRPSRYERQDDPEPIDWQRLINEAHLRALKAQRVLHQTIKLACPGPHAYVAYTDGRPEWCIRCGFSIRGIPAQSRRS